MAGLGSGNIYWKDIYLENIFDIDIENVQHLNIYLHLSFNWYSIIEDQEQWQELQWKVLVKVYRNVKYERVIINSVPAMDINAKFYLTLKLETLKVKVKDQGRNA